MVPSLHFTRPDGNYPGLSAHNSVQESKMNAGQVDIFYEENIKCPGTTSSEIAKKSIPEKRPRGISLDKVSYVPKKQKLDPKERVQKDLCDSITQNDVEKFRRCLGNGANINWPYPGKNFYPAQLAAIAGSSSKTFSEVIQMEPSLGHAEGMCIGTRCLTTAVMNLDIPAVKHFLSRGVSLGNDPYPYWSSAPYRYAADFDKDSEDLETRKSVYAMVEDAAKLRGDYVPPPKERDSYLRSL